MDTRFEMPQLEYIPILMSENIASSCCYQFVYSNSGMISSQRIFNGGSISSSYSYKIYPAITRMFNSEANIPKNHYTYFYPNIYDANYNDATALAHGKNGYWAKEVVTSYPAGSANPQQLWVIDMGDVYQANVLPGSFVTLTVPYCDHVSQKCPFNQMVGQWNQHVGSSAPHTMGGRYWYEAHPAVQFNS